MSSSIWTSGHVTYSEYDKKPVVADKTNLTQYSISAGK